MLECREITKTYGRKTAVDHISLQFAPGKIYAMLGPNGSGKTTLMKMAVGLVKPNSGVFYYNEKPVGQESRKEIAYMSTEPYFYSWMSVRDVGKYYADFFEDFSMEEYEKLIQSLEANYTQKINLIAENHRQKMDEYIQFVKNTVQNKNNFRKVLQEILQK